MQTSFTLRAALGALAVFGMTVPAHAAFTQLTDPTQILTQNIFAVPDGGSMGMTETNPITVNAGGNTATFSTMATGGLFLYDSTGQNTAFADNTALLETVSGTTGLGDGPLNIAFGQGVQAFGLFGQGGASTGSTTFTVNAYNGASLLDTFSVGPLDDNADPGTAAFLGGLATGGDTITNVSISSASTETGAGDNAIYGPLATGTAIPEASPLALIGLGLLGLPLLARRVRRTA